MTPRQGGQDFDLRRARDAPSPGASRSHRQAVPLPMEADPLQATPEVTQQAKTYGSEPVAGNNNGYITAQEFSSQDTSGRMPFSEDALRHGSGHDPGEPVPLEAGTSAAKRDSGRTEHKSRTRQRGNQYYQRFHEAAKAEEQAVQTEGGGVEPKKPSKLEFTADELPPEAKDNKLTQARRKAERTTEKLEQAEACLPSRRKLRIETASDPETGKAKKHLKFEQEVKSQRAHVKGSLPMRPVKAGANTAIGYAHKKIYQAEDENIGIKAAHRTELVGEAGLRTAYHRHKTAPYRRVSKLQQKSVRANAGLSYRLA